MTMVLYVFEDADGTLDTYTTTRYGDAAEYAQRYRRRLIEQEYEYSDSHLVADYTEAA